MTTPTLTTPTVEAPITVLVANDRAERPAHGARDGFGGNKGGRPMGRRGGARGGRGGDRPAPEFDHKILTIRRVTRVVKGGRRFSFSVILIAGDRKGRVGLGVGKASDVSLAIEKALKGALKKLITVPMKNGSIPHEVEGRFAGVQLVIRPAPGRGLIAGSAVRVILELAGVKGASAKIISRSKNKLNNAAATMKALSLLRI